MTWITSSDEDKPILEEIVKQTDRGAALIATAYLEQRLLAAIKARTNRHEKVENQIYRGSGPLGSFSAKIDLGLLLGVYEPAIHKMLHTVREIRNDFAHKPEPQEFTSERLCALCNNISIAADLELKNKTTGQAIEIHLAPDGTPRTAFLNAIKLLLLFLDMETKQLPPRVPAAPVMPPLASMKPSGKKA